MTTARDQTVLRAFSFRVKDATSGKRLTALANAVNTVWNYVNEISARSADRGLTWATKKAIRIFVGNWKSVPHGSPDCRALPESA